MAQEIRIKKLGRLGTDEWSYKEEGSYEDSGRSKDHVFAILNREYWDSKGDYMNLTRKEAETLLESIKYHCTAGWDAWDHEPLQVAAIQRTWRAYRKALTNALNQ